jgi:hypothetical protein
MEAFLMSLKNLLSTVLKGCSLHNNPWEGGVLILKLLLFFKKCESLHRTINTAVEIFSLRTQK